MSRTTRNWIIVLILVPVVAYGAVRLALWYTVKDALDGAKEALSPVASFEHAKILSPVLGPFGVTGIRIQPHVLEDSVSIGSALINIQDPVEKYQFVHAVMNDTLPTSFNLSLNEIRVSLTGDIAAWLDSNLPSSGPSADGTPTACRTGNSFKIEDLREMGYKELVGHLNLDYNYDRLNGGLVIYAQIRFEDMFEVTVEGKIPPEEVYFDVDRIHGIPKVSDLSITVDEASWNAHLNTYCAGVMGINEKEYVDRKVDDMKEMMESTGFEPSDELMDGLRRYAAGTAPITLSLNPRDPVDPTQLTADGDPKMVIDRLGIEVLVDGKPVENLGAVREESDDENQAEEHKEETFKSTPMRELALYLQSRVKIFTKSGNLHEGYLDSVGAEKLVITQHLVGGSATFDVERDDIKDVQVLRP